MDSSHQTKALIQRVFLFLEDGEWEKANQYCEEILDVEPQNAHAYLGKLMIELHIKQKADLAICKKDFEQSTNYKRILKFGDSALIEEVQQYLDNAKSLQDEEKSRKRISAEKRETTLNKIFKFALFPIALIALFVCILCYAFLPKETDLPVVEDPQPIELRYQGLTIKIPYNEKYSATVSERKICLSGAIDFSINKFLEFVYPPTGRSFYATGIAASNGAKASFCIKDYATGYTGSSSSALFPKPETVDLIFFRLDTKYEARYECKNGSWPMEFHHEGALMSVMNQGLIRDFKTGETTLIGQFKSLDTGKTTEVRIVVERQ